MREEEEEEEEGVYSAWWEGGASRLHVFLLLFDDCGGEEGECVRFVKNKHKQTVKKWCNAPTYCLV